MTRFGPDAILMFSPHVFTTKAPQWSLASPHAQYEYRGLAQEIMQRATPLIKGQWSLREIENLTGIAWPALAEVLQPMLTEDLVDIEPAIHAATSALFLSAYFELCDEWARYIFATPFWERMFEGSASREEVLGWGIEFYHRTLGADEHNRISVERCSCDTQIRTWLEEHFREEYGHGEMFLRGLVACGFKREEIEHSTALSSTRGLIEFFNELAATDTVAYLGCYGVLHSPRVGQTADRVKSQFQHLISLYPFAEGVLSAIREHALLDLELEHDQIVLERFAEKERFFSPEMGARILRAARGTVVAFCNYFRGIHEYYGSHNPILVRPNSSAAEAR